MSKTHNVTVIPGDGIGPEVMSATIKVVESAGVSINWNFARAGLDALKHDGSLLPGATLGTIARDRVAIKGPTGTPIGEGHRSINVELREYFDLFANVRPVKNFPGVRTRCKGVDIELFRENLEDLYVAEERMVNEKTAEAVSRITWEESTRLASFAFERARASGRRKVTVGHKANILKKTHGLWLGAVSEVARQYPEIEFEQLIADNLAMQLVMRPKRFDCILLPNFLGDVLSDLCAGLVGGLGFAPGANIGKEYAIFEAVHGTAPDIAGKGIANPTALILSAALMLEHLGEEEAARKVEGAVRRVFADGISTADVRSKHIVSTEAFTQAVIERI